MSVALTVAAVLFAVVHGLNTGASLLALSTSIPVMRLWVSLLIMTGGVALAPFLLGTGVATTLADELVTGEAEQTQLAMLVAVVVTIAVITVLSLLKVPSSLTLALVGALAGYGVASAQSVSAATLVKVLVMMAIAPVIGAVFSQLLARILPFLPRSDIARGTGAMHILGYTILSFAYGGNDAQKMLAVWAVAMGTAGGGVSAHLDQVLICAGLFALGSALGVSRMAKTMSTGVLAARPGDIATTELATTGALLVSTAFGAPVGLAQTLSGALVGAGLARGVGRIRWQAVSKIVMAWFCTLPAAFLLALMIGLVVAR